MNSELAERSLLHGSLAEWLQWSGDRNGTRLPSLSSRAASVSRSMSRLRALWRWSVRAVFLSAALTYATLSLLADAEYGVGMRTGDPAAFQRASRLFPLFRTRRSGAAYAYILRQDAAGIPEIKWAIAHDPNAADLWYGLARIQLKMGDHIGYNSSLTRLKQLTPGLSYQVIREAH